MGERGRDCGERGSYKWMTGRNWSQVYKLNHTWTCGHMWWLVMWDLDFCRSRYFYLSMNRSSSQQFKFSSVLFFQKQLFFFFFLGKPYYFVYYIFFLLCLTEIWLGFIDIVFFCLSPHLSVPFTCFPAPLTPLYPNLSSGMCMSWRPVQKVGLVWVKNTSYKHRSLAPLGFSLLTVWQCWAPTPSLLSGALLVSRYSIQMVECLKLKE